MIFNCAFVLFLGLTTDLKKLRRFIETKKTSLHVAAGEYYLVFCKLLLCCGAIVDSPDTRKQTNLNTAASREHIDICNLLIDIFWSICQQG